MANFISRPVICAFLTGVSGAALIATPARAEEAQAASPTAGGVQEIIVTAQRRSQNVQDVPISVTVANSEMLAVEHVTNIQNIEALSPSITYVDANSPASTPNLQIRGIGTTGPARTFEGAVGVFVDGVYRSRSGEALTDFLDVDSLQILKGPQGTLFGKNTTGGAILVKSVEPSTTDYKGNFEAGYGNYNAYTLRAAVNVPVSDKIAIRVSAVSVGHDGYISTPNGGNLNNKANLGFKVQLLLKPTEDLSIKVIADYARERDNCCYGTVNIIPGPLGPLVNALTLANGLTPASTNINDRQGNATPNANNRIDDGGVSLHIDYTLGDGTLSSVTALRRYKVLQLNEDADFSGISVLNLDEGFTSKFFSQELTYNGHLSGAIKADYVFGAFYSHETDTDFRNLRWGSQAQMFWDALLGAAGVPAGTADAAPGLFGSENMLGTSNSYAAYSHWDFKFSDAFDLIAGARYSREEKTGQFAETYFRDPLLDPLALVGVMPGIGYNQSVVNQAVSGTVGVQYRPATGVMTYLTYNRGFKAGGVNIDVNAAGIPGSVVFGSPGVSQSPVYAPETVDAFEAGIKADWLGKKARTNIAVFYDSLHSLQVAEFVGLQYLIANAPSAKVAGAEFEQTFKLGHGFTFSAAGTYLPEAKFGTTSVLGYPLSGRRMVEAAHFAGNVALFGFTPVSNDWAVTSRIQAQYSGSVYVGNDNDITQGPVTLVNVSLGLASLKNGLQIEAYAENLLNRAYVTGAFGVPIETGSYNAFLGAPRTYGVRARFSF
ncbi:TonB-dependent receptor [Novosphingobium sp. Fuku2-ISO-50]|uniref:TonB-dependent receptor n=1 Tax=Novosphingobium sp. Fuku2-ISO-50 TaxID=1739114 RepID=UPI00076C3862|nr:TonB-dependent receptor [Novosphingobium sp. Fuku2-ISO-50]KUR73906.1 hypothetical protein AQZ50_18940 [Novosphingobium sp. Fuku2-ISO-50]